MTSPPASVGNARRYFPGRPSATVSPETSTVRPAVDNVCATASAGVRPAASSSRNRLTTNNA